MNNLDPPIRLLLVDDDAMDRETVRRALQPLGAGVSVQEATCVAEADQLLARGEFDCVVLDYLLPEGPCFDFIHRLRETMPHAALVVLTGQGDESVAVQLMKAGAADYLSKDTLDAGRLRGAVKLAVALRRAQRMASHATAERDRHARHLKRFVERAPEIVSARSLEALARTTAVVAADMLEAPEACVLLHRSEGPVLASAPRTDESELAVWASKLLVSELSSACVRSGERAAVGLISRDGECRGALALRLPAGSDPGTQEQLVCQLGVLASVCIDNLLLYDAAARAVRARDDVMAVVSHDLRTPLNNIRLGTSLLRDGADANTRTVVDRVERNVALMARLVDDLVDMVRIESGVIDLRTACEPVSELLQAAVELVAAQASAAQQRFDVKPAPPSMVVRADRERVLQVLANLLGNAVKFSPPGAKIALAATEQAGSVLFEVADNGRGIGEEEGDKVFARFWQSDPKKRRGLGLGLYIAKGLVAAHGGSLWYESQRGEGTRFFFTLPRVGAASSQPTTEV